jgi:hypothetical protein
MLTSVIDSTSSRRKSKFCFHPDFEWSDRAQYRSAVVGISCVKGEAEATEGNRKQGTSMLSELQASDEERQLMRHDHRIRELTRHFAG